MEPLLLLKSILSALVGLCITLIVYLMTTPDGFDRSLVLTGLICLLEIGTSVVYNVQGRRSFAYMFATAIYIIAINITSIGALFMAAATLGLQPGTSVSGISMKFFGGLCFTAFFMVHGILLASYMSSPVPRKHMEYKIGDAKNEGASFVTKLKEFKI